MAASSGGISPSTILVAQTGVIGRPFPIDKIKNGIPKLCSRLSAKGQGAARGIMTTDTYPKEYAVSFKLQGKEVRLASIAKGSGMIHPNMGTMLCFLTTDAAAAR